MAFATSRAVPAASLRGVASPSLRYSRSIAPARFAAPARRQAVSVRASDKQTIDFEKVKDSYEKVTNAIPPVLTAATTPVIALSVLCKTLTGSGLPGNFLGSVEGLSYLIFFAGLGSFLPRASVIVQGRDFSPEAILEALNDKTEYSDTEDLLGKDATQRLNTFSKKLDKSSALGAQMADIEKARKEREAETPEQRAMKEKLRKELAAKALAKGQEITATDDKKVETEGEEKIYATPVMETLKDCMTTENYDVDVTKFDDKDLGDKLNLSANKIESGAPANNPGDKWREQYRVEK